MKRLARRLLLLVLALCLVVVVLEAGVRLVDPFGVSHFRDMQRYFHELSELIGPPRLLRHRPSTEVAFRGFTIRTNALRLRGPELSANKAPGEYRILFLGDSVVLGWGANQGELFVTRAEQELNQSAPADRRYVCINAGHNQYDTVQEAALLEEVGERLQPDAVLLVYVGNDVLPTIRVWNELERLRAAAPPDPIQQGWNWLRAVPFRGLNAIYQYFAHRQIEQATAGERHHDPEGWRRSSGALLGIRDWCKRRGLPFVVLDHTHPATGTRAAEVPELIPFLESSGIRRFPFHFTIEERARPIRRSKSDAHANRLGHTLLLAKLHPVFEALGLKTR